MSNTFRGTILRLHERFTGRQILDRLEELNRTQWLSRDELQSLQLAKLQRLVEYSYRFVPYYKRVFDEAGFQPIDLQKDLVNFKKIPILTKTLIRDNWDDLLTTEDARRSKLSRLATSGSTGQPLVFMQDSNFRDCVTADIQRNLGWAGWKLGDKHAFIWGQGYKKSFWKSFRTQLIDWVWNRFLTNAFVMTEESMSDFAKKIIKQNPRILFGYATSLYRFAQYIHNSPYQGITFDGIFSSAELLIPSVREFIENTFHCKVYNRYGTLELGGVACECVAHSGLHISVENNYVEIIRDKKIAEPGMVGDLIVTNLNNYGMPFIRYQIGDLAAWDEKEHCSCGRASPMLKSLEGRTVDTFQTRDGRVVWAGFAGAAFRCLTHPAIKQFQVVQKSLDMMVVRLVKEGELPQSALDEICEAIRVTFGEDIAVEFEFQKEILPLPSGKHQYAVSELNRYRLCPPQLK